MSEKNPWKRLNSKTVYRNDWMSVREDRVIRPDGKEGIYGLVETRVATGAVALTPNGDIYLVGQYRYPTEMYSWEIIQGGADPGEDPREAIQREMLEEAGLVASSLEPLGGAIHLSNCISSEIGYVFLARGLEQRESNPDGTEVLQIRRLPMPEAVAMVDSGEIVDAVSIIGIKRAAEWLAQNTQ